MNPAQKIKVGFQGKLNIPHNDVAHGKEFMVVCVESTNYPMNYKGKVMCRYLITAIDFYLPVDEFWNFVMVD